MEKVVDKFGCDICDYRCSRAYDLKKHLSTRKHALRNAQQQDSRSLSCEHCSKVYKDRTGLWRHYKRCSENAGTAATVQPSQNNLSSDVVLELIKQNREFKELLLEQNNKLLQNHAEQLKQNEKIIEYSTSVIKAGHTTTHNTIHHTTNQFNLNIFLNETCKDAINMKDFVDTVQIQMNELENVGKNGYVTGISDIIVSRLRELDISKRPLHCTDLKRETMYVKDNDEWNKDEENKAIKKMITKVATKNYKKIPEWREENPDCQDAENQKYDFCITMMRNSLGDIGDEQTRLDEKIVKNIAKQVTLKADQKLAGFPHELLRDVDVDESK
jgi:hypothetical protein